MSPSLQSVTIPAGRIEYRWIGARQSALREIGKPVIVLLHEGLGSVALWKDFPDRLAAAAELPVLVYSRIGYGGSDPCVLPRPITYMHEEGEGILPELLAALDVGPHILVGHSDGASIALIYAGARQPDTLLGVAAMAPHVFCEDISVQSIRAASKAYARGDLRSRLEKYHGANVDCAFHGWCDSWLNPDFLHWNIESHVDRITVPVLAIQGEDDEYGTKSQVDSIARRTGAEILMLPACGHSPHRDQPEATLQALRRFIRNLTDRP